MSKQCINYLNGAATNYTCNSFKLNRLCIKCTQTVKGFEFLMDERWQAKKFLSYTIELNVMSFNKITIIEYQPLESVFQMYTVFHKKQHGT